MKKIQKILIGTGIGYLVGKFIKDHLKIEININTKESDKPVEMAVKLNNDDENVKKFYDGVLEQFVNHEDEETNNIHCDHVYYDNPYNICKIHFDRNGCPSAFEFSNGNDRNVALMDFTRNYLQMNDNRGCRFSLKDIFDFLGLIIDDYPEFEQRFVCWTSKDFVEANEENALETILDFGEFEVNPV